MSMKTKIKTALAVFLFLLVIGVIGGMENETIPLGIGLLLSTLSLAGLYLLGRPHMINAHA